MLAMMPEHQCVGGLYQTRRVHSSQQVITYLGIYIYIYICRWVHVHNRFCKQKDNAQVSVLGQKCHVGEKMLYS